MCDSIAFDFDGTLIDISIRDYLIYRDILTEGNYKYLSFNNYWEMRRSKINIFNLLQSSNVDEKYFDYFIQKRKSLIEVEEYLKKDILFPHTIKTLKDLTQHYNCYLVTMRNNKFNALRQIEWLGINGYFKEIIVTPQNKINTFSKIKNLKFVIGDTENDIIPANKLAIISIAITTGIRNEKSLKEYEPNFLIKDLIEIKNILYNV